MPTGLPTFIRDEITLHSREMMQNANSVIAALAAAYRNNTLTADQACDIARLVLEYVRLNSTIEAVSIIVGPGTDKTIDMVTRAALVGNVAMDTERDCATRLVHLCETLLGMEVEVKRQAGPQQDSKSATSGLH